MDVAAVRINIKAREDGAWFSDFAAAYPFAVDLRVMVRGWYCHDARKMRAELEAARTDEHRKNAYTLGERQKDEERQVLHKVCLLGWENLTDGGAAVEFTDANAYRFIYSDEFEELASVFKYAALRISNLREESIKAAAKNSETGSDGGSETPRTQTPKKKAA